MVQVDQLTSYQVPQINQVSELQGYPMVYPPQVNFVVRPDQVVLTGNKKHNNLLAGIMSLIIPGSGQMAEGNAGKGLKQLVIAGALDIPAVLLYKKAKAWAEENSMASIKESAEAGIKNVAEKAEKEAVNGIIKKAPHSFAKIWAAGVLAAGIGILGACVHTLSSYTAYKGSHK